MNLNVKISWFTWTLWKKSKIFKARAMVLWLRQTAHDLEVVGSNPGTVYWMDVSHASYYINTQENNEKKVAKWGTPKKYKKRNQNSLPFLASSQLSFSTLVLAAFLDAQASPSSEIFLIEVSGWTPNQPFINKQLTNKLGTLLGTNNFLIIIVIGNSCCTKEYYSISALAVAKKNLPVNSDLNS